MIDPRIIRFGVEVNGQLRVYQDAWIVATGTKFANPLQNEANIAVANLSKDVRNYLLTETSPYNGNRTPKRVVIEAGRQSIGVGRIFVGDIVSCTPSQPPDIVLTFKAKTQQYSKGDIVAVSAPSLEQLSVLSERVSNQLGTILDFQAEDRQVKNFTFTGGKLQLVQKLQEAGAVQAFVDDDRLIVKDTGKPLVGVTHVLSLESGMIGIPEATEYGCKVTMMFDPRVRLGGRLELRSVMNPAMNGNYTIYKLDFDLATRDTPFYWVAHCTREGWTNAKRIPE